MIGFQLGKRGNLLSARVEMWNLIRGVRRLEFILASEEGSQVKKSVDMGFEKGGGAGAGSLTSGGSEMPTSAENESLDERSRGGRVGVGGRGDEGGAVLLEGM